MQEEICDLCGYAGERGAIERCHIIPQEVREQAGMRRSKIAKLCPNCKQELIRWYATRVSEMTYDNGAKQFRAKSWPELVKEYKNAFAIFAGYKKGQKKER